MAPFIGMYFGSTEAEAADAFNAPFVPQPASEPAVATPRTLRAAKDRKVRRFVSRATRGSFLYRVDRSGGAGLSP